MGRHLTKRRYNQMRMASYFFQSIAADHVLMFERDTVLCGRSSHKMKDFMPFDYVGAPWPPQVSWCSKLRSFQCCCNSGLALINTSGMVNVLNTFNVEEASHQNDMYLLHYRRQTKKGARFIFAETPDAMKFSTEAVWDGKSIPFGVHKPWWGYEEFRSTDLHKLHQACPEISLLCPYANHSVRAKVAEGRSGGRHVHSFLN